MSFHLVDFVTDSLMRQHVANSRSRAQNGFEDLNGSCALFDITTISGINPALADNDSGSHRYTAQHNPGLVKIDDDAGGLLIKSGERSGVHTFAGVS